MSDWYDQDWVYRAVAEQGSGHSSVYILAYMYHACITAEKNYSIVLFYKNKWNCAF